MSVWSKIYERINWKDLPQRLTALAARNLNKMDLAIDTLDDRTIGLNTRLEAVEENPITVDTELKPDSANPVQNKVIYAAFEDLLPEETVQGNPISINDASGLDAKACSVDLLPIQDLHGYDSPWVGGAGKNLLPCTGTSDSISGTTITINSDGSMTIKNTPSANISNYTYGTILLPAGTYKVNGFSGGASNNIRLVCRNNDTNENIALIYQNRDIEFTLTENTNIRVFPIIPTTWDGTEVTMYPMIRLSTVADGTFEPYSNICPISGRTQVNFVRNGINQFDENTELGSISTADGTPQASNNYIRSVNYSYCGSNTPYYIIHGNKQLVLYWYDVNKNYLGYDVSGSTEEGIKTSPNNAHYFKIRYGSGITTYDNSISINYPSTDTAYHAYQGQTNTETLGQTVYGGKVDFVSGGATSNMAICTVNNLTNLTRVQTSTSGVYRWVGTLSPTSSVQASDTDGYISSKLSNASANDIYAGRAENGVLGINTTAVYIRYDEATTVEELLTAIGDCQICYELATPTELTTTAEQISLLKGSNVISTDGDNINLKYSADIKAWVENQLSV